MLGLFITGTNTEVGKTFVAALIARQLVNEGHKVAVYKPVASGCIEQDGDLISEDAVQLWEAAGRPVPLADVCPQRFTAPVSPHRAAALDGTQVDEERLRSGLSTASAGADIVLVEGAGGLMSPVSDDEFNADLAFDFGYPVIVVANNALGIINQTLQTLITAETFRDGLDVAGVVLNNQQPGNDASQRWNPDDLRDRCVAPLLAEVPFGATSIEPRVDWMEVASTSH